MYAKHVLKSISRPLPGRINQTRRWHRPVSTCSPEQLVQQRKSSRTAATAPASGDLVSYGTASDETAANIVVLVPHSSISPFKSAEWSDVMGLMSQRVSWEEENIVLRVFQVEYLTPGSSARDDFEQACRAGDMLLAVDMRSESSRELLMKGLETPRAINLIMDSSKDLQNMSQLGGIPVTKIPEALLKPLSKLESFPGTLGKAAKTWPLLQLLWSRRSSDDLAFMFLLAINDFVTPVKSTQANMGDLESMYCMCTKCRDQITACVQDPECKAALDALAACNLNDQVCSYRVIASYESELLERFSLCILQKHNCLRNYAEVPMTPGPVAMTQYRGSPLTHDMAEDIFLGNLAPEYGDPFSWRVVCGKNAAYDVFPCQYQIFYRGKAKGSMWYDPVFKVIQLNGEQVWRRRHYRVKRDEVPGTFNFSVLDNGVISKEFWRIIDCAEDMEWAVFYYSGAASTAGITYRGALICTATGNWPKAADADARIEAALHACGIRSWEMYSVDNCDCCEAPLDLPESANIEPKSLTALSR